MTGADSKHVKGMKAKVLRGPKALQAMIRNGDKFQRKHELIDQGQRSTHIRYLADDLLEHVCQLGSWWRSVGDFNVGMIMSAGYEQTAPRFGLIR